MVNPGDEAAARKQTAELRFRASLISSGSMHLAVLVGAIFAPAMWPRPQIMPNVTPVRLIRLPPAAAPVPKVATPEPEAPEPEAPEPEAPEPEPEPLPALVTEPEPIPRTLEQLRRDQEEEKRIDEEEAERLRAEAEARRRAERERQAREKREREERERLEREDAARRAPQKAARRTKKPPQTQSARRSIDFTGTEANQQSFTIENFPFVDYVMRIRDMVASRWSPPTRGAYAKQLRVEVFFRIGRGGQILVQPRAPSTSGDTLYDQAALRAIASAAPFPPLPREYEGQSLGVRFAFVQE